MDELYTKADARPVERTFYNGHLKVGRPIPAAESSDGKEGWWSDERFTCPHDHESREAATMCAVRAEGYVLRHGRVPAGWSS
jgi:hypothetical protein